MATRTLLSPIISQRVKWQHTGEKESGKAKSSWPFPLNMKLGNGTTGILEQPQESNKEKIEKLKGEFIALQYAAFIRYAFMQLRNLLGFLATASTLVFIALNVYPFQPMGTLTNFATFLFALGAIVVVTVFYQMEKDPLLSRLANTTAGKLESGFALRLLQFGALPTVTFLATHFPPIGQALVRITQIIPGLAKL